MDDQSFWQQLQPHVLTDEEMKTNAFPMPDPDNPTMAKFYSIHYYDRFFQRNITARGQKQCCRCGKAFALDPNEPYPTEQCNYHWGRSTQGLPRLLGIYNCCEKSESCTVARCHVYDMNKYTDRTGYVKTVSCQQPVNGVYAIDCETVFTTHGRELANVAVVDENLRVVYETLVKPDHEVVEYQTRFSGIRDGSLTYTRTTLKDVQNKILELFSEKTVMIGHDIQRDVLMMKIFHSTIVDISLVFPSSRGPTSKKPLKLIVQDCLRENVQDHGRGEYKCRGNAIACMKLMRHKITSNDG